MRPNIIIQQGGFMVLRSDLIPLYRFWCVSIKHESDTIKSSKGLKFKTPVTISIIILYSEKRKEAVELKNCKWRQMRAPVIGPEEENKVTCSRYLVVDSIYYIFWVCVSVSFIPNYGPSTPSLSLCAICVKYISCVR